MGDVKELIGAYFDCAEKYNVLVKLISIYYAREYTHGGDIRHVVMKMERLTLLVPVDPH